MKILALDIGKARIGIAESDETEFLASPVETLYCKSWNKDTDYISNYVSKKNIKKIVVGYPLNLDGSKSEMTEYVLKFSEMLKSKTSAEIVFQDERLSSSEAEEIMHYSNVKTKKKKGLIDQIAATVILQTYLDLKRKEN